MNTRISRHDLSYLTSAALLIVATVTAVTGLVSDLWDLNDFVYHKYGGYAMAILALAHVTLHWGRLVSYTRWRLREHPRQRRGINPQQKARIAKNRRVDRVNEGSGVICRNTAYPPHIHSPSFGWPGRFCLWTLPTDGTGVTLWG